MGSETNRLVVEGRPGWSTTEGSTPSPALKHRTGPSGRQIRPYRVPASSFESVVSGLAGPTKHNVGVRPSGLVRVEVLTDLGVAILDQAQSAPR